MALDMLCQEMYEAWLLGVVTERVLSSHRGRAVTAKERDVVRGNKWKGSVAGLGGLSGPVDILPYYFGVVCTPCAFWRVSSVPWCL